MDLLFGKSKKNKNNDLKIIAKPNKGLKQRRKSLESPTDIIYSKCCCCGTNIPVKSDINKFKCGICHVTTILIYDEELVTNVDKDLVCSSENLNRIIKNCLSTVKKQQIYDKNEKYNALEPISRYVSDCFHSYQVLERSFLPNGKRMNSHSLVDFEDVNKFYALLMKLPTRRPFYRMLCACNDLLKKPGKALNHIRWLLIIWEIPFIRYCLTTKVYSKFDSPEIRAVSYELSKRCICYISNTSRTDKYSEYIYCLKYMDSDIFLSNVEKINLYITYQLTRIMCHAIKRNSIKERKGDPMVNTNNTQAPTGTISVPTTTNNFERTVPLARNSNTNILTNDDFSPASEPLIEDLWNISPEEIKTIEFDRDGKSLRPKGFKFKTSQYEHNWYIRSACKLMLIINLANTKRGNNPMGTSRNVQLSASKFYNTMLDFLDNKQDFEVWRGLDVGSRLSLLLTEWSAPQKQNNSTRFSFCNYPFLLSLGIKISIMEYETKRIMEYQAEKAFLSSLDKGKTIEVYFKIKIRRDHITHDSLKAIKEHQGDLLKSLRIEFINEPGIDAGGLRKEWFILLTKSLFSPTTGLFDHIKDSRLCWFPIVASSKSKEKVQSQEEYYYLLGVVIALAMFNGNILDLSFPKALYKKMCNETLTFADYTELYPETASNLLKMLEYSKDDFNDVFCLTFETTYHNKLTANNKGSKKSKGSNTVTVELCKNGSNIPVTQSNKSDYVKLWIDFYLTKSVAASFERFMDGFSRVFSNCKSIGLFNSEELERLLCGDDEHTKYDFQMLRSVTKYQGGFTNETSVVNWFWEILEDWDYKMQATGISTLTFKISRLGARDNNDLPIAHTCFNELCIWEYSSKEKLENKLMLAVTESEGFGFR
ncbi:putative E3 ubiquitin-protein ligase [Maudiozyma exigua]|uniref:HECT-type E3 ubiquitin transferase n=1 Tax=Maudiozyma exigua TaxID=34358 RepID=A0A9P7B6W0_MAUEX|nr:putative E3 ubiquitin-protein ligase [Kazachstania exigua]